MVWVFCTTAAVKENGIVAKVAADWNKAQQQNDVSLTLSCFAQLRNNLLKQGYTVLGDFADPGENH